MQMGMKEIRLREMEQYVFDHDTVSMEELSGHFDISMNTVRSDVAQLVKDLRRGVQQSEEWSDTL